MLFRAICGLISLSSGEIIIDGKKLHDEISFPQSVGALIENPGFLPNYSGKENLKFINRDENWLIKEIKKQGFLHLDQIFLATYDNNNNLSIYKKLDNKNLADPFG